MSSKPASASFDGARSIRTLSPDTISKLRSSVNITSLSDAISELVQNSIDARAKHIKVFVNLDKNSCIVEDDGFGISPNDMKQLGQRYASSKHAERQALATFGFRGEALASIAAHSSLAITSRAHTHRSTTMVRFSYNNRSPTFSGPAPDHLRIVGDRTSGTIVRLEGLFGDFPVRMKARADMEDFEREREWSGITKSLAALMVTLNAHGINLSLKDAAASGIKAHRLAIKQYTNLDPDHQRDPWELRVLRQFYTSRDNPIGSDDEWERVKARKGGISIEGWICKEPSPTKQYQFISVNNHPLSSSSYLHSDLNSIFQQSRFSIPEAFEEDENGKLVASKRCMDKWVKCILNISIEGASGHFDVGGEQGTSGKSGIVGETLTKVSNLMQYLLAQFLRNQHLAPRAPVVKWDKIHHFGASSKSTTSNSKINIKAPINSSPSKHQTALLQSRINKSPASISKPALIDKARPIVLDLTEYSKAKAAKHDNREEQGRTITKATTKMTLKPSVTAGQEPIILSDSEGDQENGDRHKRWIDPSTKRMYKINTRTGNLELPKAKAKGDNSQERTSGVARFAPSGSKRIRLEPDAKKSEPPPSLKRILDNWTNPVYQAGEALPQKTALNPLGTLPDPCRDCHGDDFLEKLAQSETKISVESLHDARIIGQVDRKFILLRTTEADRSPSSLILIDQHAASERVRIEGFLARACAIPAPTEAPEKELNFEITSDERMNLKKYHKRMARWGIFYGLTSSPRAGGEVDIMTVKSLPAAVSSRCSKDPRLAVELIRKYLYELVGASASPEPPLEHKDANWLMKYIRMPKALLDLLNSKACRGAIMFNDALNMDQMETLMMDLGQTSFPFQCAHGRPSMVPLGEVEKFEDWDDDEDSIGLESYPSRFADWMRREKEAEESEEEGGGRR